jgi:HAD superfamily hydrolase (TIGR01549 family)
MIDAVLFDLGDTLRTFDTTCRRRLFSVAAPAGYGCMSAHGLAVPSLRRYRRAVWRSVLWATARAWVCRREIQLLDALYRAHRRMGMDITWERHADLVREAMIPIREYIRTEPDAIETLTAIRDAGYKMAVVSNTIFPAYSLDADLGAEGLLEFFPVRVYSSEVRYRKPHPTIFQIALNLLGVPARSALFVGDSVVNDIHGAQRLGMRTILISSDGKRPGRRARPDHVIRRLTEIPPILRSYELDGHGADA